MKIILQLIRQDSGILVLDGKEIRHDDIPSWSRLFAYVTQDSFVLSDTIESNIAFGIPESAINTKKSP